MKKIIKFSTIFFLLLLPLVLSKIELQTVYSLQMEIFRDDTATLKNILADTGTISTFPTQKTVYSIKVFGGNQVLFDKNIGVSFLLTLEPLKTIQLNSTLIHIRVPYFKNADRIAVYHQNKEILNIDLSKEICNNNSFCEIGENKYNCPEDCKGIQSLSFLLILLMIILISIIIYFLLKKLRK